MTEAPLIEGAEVRREIGAEYHVIEFGPGRLWAVLTFSPVQVRYRWCCDREGCRWSGTEVATFGEAQDAALAHVCGQEPSRAAPTLF